MAKYACVNIQTYTKATSEIAVELLYRDLGKYLSGLLASPKVATIVGRAQFAVNAKYARNRSVSEPIRSPSAKAVFSVRSST